MTVSLDKLKGKVEKTFIYKGKMVNIISIEDDSNIFCFKIWDKGNKKHYYSNIYQDIVLCEKDSMKVVRKI